MARRCLPVPLAFALVLAAALAALPLGTAAGQTSQGTADAKGLAAPGKLWAAQVSPTEVTLTWGTVTGALGYRVFVQNPKGELVRLGDLSASGTRYIAGIAAIGRLLGATTTQIQFVVRALGAGGVLGPQAVFNPVTLQKLAAGTKAANAPTNVRVREQSPGVVTLTWDEVPGATAYAIGRSRGTSGLQRLCDVCPIGGQYVDTVPATGIRYVYRVAALTPAGAGRATMSDSIVPTGVVLAGPAGGTPSTGADEDLKGLADKASLTVRTTPMTGILQVIGSIGRTAPGVVVRLMRQVCNGPLREVRRIADQVPFQIDERFGGLDFPECGLVDHPIVRYVLQFSDPKGLVAESKSATATLPGQGVATAGDSGATSADPKGHAAGVSIAANPILGAPRVVRVLVQLATPLAQGVTARLMRQVCNGPLQVVDRIIDNAPFQLDDALGGFPDCDGSDKLAVRYTVQFSDAKGLVANSKMATVELPGAVASATPTDPKGHAEGVSITATPRVGGPRIIRVLVQAATPIAQGITARLMRQACNGPLRAIARIADNAPFQLDDALGGLDFPECNGFSKLAIRYSVQFSDPKGLVANSKAAAVELEKDVVATAPPTTPVNLRIARLSNGSRILTWDAVAGATRYRIERVVGAKGAWSFLREVDGTVKSYTDTAAVSETPRYRITAVNAAGSSAAGVFP